MTRFVPVASGDKGVCVFFFQTSKEDAGKKPMEVWNSSGVGAKHDTAVEHSHITHGMDQSSGRASSHHGAPPQPQQALDLGEWKGQRVLAKRGNVYMPGVIVSINGPSTLTVLFDQDQVSIPYNDVTSYFDIVADTSPAHAQVRC